MEFAEYLSGALLKCVFPFFPDHDVFCLDPLSSKAMWWSISWKAIDLPSWVQLASRHSFTYAKFYSIILLFGTWEFTWRGFVVLVDVYSVKFIMNNMHYTTCLSSSSFVLLLYMHASLLGIDWSHLTFCVMKWSNLLMTLHIICARAQCLVSHLYDVWQVSLISAAMIRS